MRSLNLWLSEKLDALHTDHLYRTRSTAIPYQQVRFNGYLNFSSNDYLGLASDPRLHTASATCHPVGLGSGASALISGYHTIHQKLEEALAQFLNRPATLLFPSGYMANLAITDTLLRLDPTSYALHDRLNHASLFDGTRLSGARFRRYPHLNLTRLAQHLRQKPDDRVFIFTESLFSMDGDKTPLAALVQLVQETHPNAYITVDESHSFGLYGTQGQGLIHAAGLNTDHIPIMMGTFGKALGGGGAFVSGDKPLIEALCQWARPYIYTTALSPLLAQGALNALNIIQNEPERRLQLFRNIDYFCTQAQLHNLPLGQPHSPIQPLILGDNQRALRWAKALQGHKIIVTAIRPPTVPHNQSRLRFTLSALHTSAEIDQLLKQLVDLYDCDPHPHNPQLHTD
jgi:8-amino-7-oxononanoate synthase